MLGQVVRKAQNQEIENNFFEGYEDALGLKPGALRHRAATSIDRPQVKGKKPIRAVTRFSGPAATKRVRNNMGRTLARMRNSKLQLKNSYHQLKCLRLMNPFLKDT